VEEAVQYLQPVVIFVFTPDNWATPQEVTIRVPDNSDKEGTQTARITHEVTSNDKNFDGANLPDITVTIIDNDSPGIQVMETGGSTSVSENGQTDTYEIFLFSQPKADVSVTVNTGSDTLISGGSCAVPSGSCTFTFTPLNWNTNQTVKVYAIDDTRYEANHTDILTHSVISPDPDYNNFNINSITVTIADNDSTDINLSETGGSTNIAEGGATDNYTIVLSSEPASSVAIDVTADGQSQITGGSCPIPAATCTFSFTPSNWYLAQTVTVTASDDVASEGAHTSTIIHSASSSDPIYNGIPISNIIANINDNDAPPSRFVAVGDNGTNLVVFRWYSRDLE
jgi:hypothetical protein